MNSEKVLIIDENEKRSKHLAHFLSGLSLNVATSFSFSEAFNSLLKHDKFSLIIASLTSFNSNNIKILHSIKKISPHLSVVVLSKLDNPQLAISLIKQGLIDNIAMPNNLAQIYASIRSELRKINLIKEKENFLRNLKKLSLEHSSNIKKALELENIYNTTIENLMTALDLRDVETLGHSQTVAKYSNVLAEILGIRNKTILNNIRKGALLHDIGKIAIPDSILKKPGRLSSYEWEKIRLHPSLGFGLIKEIKLLKEAGHIILFHHERYDGNGYPKGLRKENIPLEARIFSLADALDAITSHRPYRKERNFEIAKEEIKKNSRSQFDPKVVDAFCSLDLEKWQKIKFETTKLLPSFEDLKKWGVRSQD